MTIEGSNNFESEIGVSSFKDLDQEFSHKYLFVRAVNQLMNGYDFYSSVDPYSPHITIAGDRVDRIYDNTFSWIDLKSSSWKEIMKFVVGKLDSIYKQDPLFFNKILHIDEKDNISTLTLIAKIKKIVSGHSFLESVDHKTKERIKNAKYETIKRLYRLIPETKNFFEDDSGMDCIKLSPEGAKYFTKILSNLIYHYDKTLALGKNWKNQIFPNEIFEYELNKISKNIPLNERELHDIIAYLSRDTNDDEANYLAKNGEVSDIKTIKNMTNGLKSFVLNHAYASIYVEQHYNHFLIEQLTNEWSKDYCEEDKYFTEKSQKGLASSANKELRKETIQDRTRARTWVDKAILQSKDSRVEDVTDIFTKELTDLKQSFERQGYVMNILSIEVANKYTWGDIIIDSDGVELIQKNLDERFSTIKNTEKQVVSQKKKQKSIAINNEFCSNVLSFPPKIIQGVQKAFDADTRKSGGNGEYADIKIRVAYALTHKDLGEEIRETGGYEHQIVHFDSSNEAGLSNHDVILEPRKNIINQIRNKGQISIDEFRNSVHGGLTALIVKLRQREDWLNIDKKNWNHRESRDFIEKQFLLRNLVPREFCILAGLQEPMTYTDIANNLEYKNKIERAIEVYLLQQLFDSHLIHRYLYASDETDLGNKRGSRIDKSLSVDHYCSYGSAETYLTQALNAEPNQKKNFRILGGGSGNLVNSLRNGTISEAGYIGINYVGREGSRELAFMKVDRIANILYQSMIKDGDHDFGKEIADLLGKA